MKKYVIVGTGNRALEMFIRPIVNVFSDEANIIAIFDINIKRAEYISKLIPYDVKVYDNLDKMLDETDADICIVATTDFYHETVISKALSKNMHVISEKPIVINNIQCNKLLRLSNEMKEKVIVTLNSRYMPVNKKIKDIIKQNDIGEILHINYNWYLDSMHGAEYFRRWHRYKNMSGSLMVHKSVHHFDLVNWWLNDIPSEVMAKSDLMNYGGNRQKHGYRCKVCKEQCNYHVTEQQIKEFQSMYFNNEDCDGYIRDKCIYDEDIDTFDTMNVLVKYRKGTLLSYSCVTYAPYLGWNLTISGSLGQISVNYMENMKCNKISVNFNELSIPKKEYVVNSNLGMKHNGADRLLQEALFHENIEKSLLNLDEGIHAVVIGVCANKSIELGKNIKISEFINI